MQNQLLAIVMVAVLPMVSAHHTKRPPPKPVPPLIHNGIEYRAPQHVDHLGTVEAWDVKTRQRIWWRQIYVVRIDVAMETDVQWVFIKSMTISGNTLIIVNERGRQHELDLGSLEVSAPKGNLDETQAIELAKETARRLAYPLETMTVQCEREGGLYVVTFLPRATLLGGDLTVKINARNGHVIDVIRGQ